MKQMNKDNLAKQVTASLAPNGLNEDDFVVEIYLAGASQRRGTGTAVMACLARVLMMVYPGRNARMVASTYSANTPALGFFRKMLDDVASGVPRKATSWGRADDREVTLLSGPVTQILERCERLMSGRVET